MENYVFIDESLKVVDKKCFEASYIPDFYPGKFSVQWAKKLSKKLGKKIYAYTLVGEQ